ncbi:MULTISPECIES: hypothetical protein [Limnospira]|uniref:Uncharacterized protein n=3 Tax=Limnospira TaxID=2596745 RepID=A0A9P1KM77_9CYAN|nr:MULTISPECIES: hypothetical protein [Limnospira]EDZ94122.1 hypothetical protein AmaxDRAFT_3190 [Limnospira maxima CS-328]EKD09227.1 hypothetical protein SPLC1_S206280 [Arthrospira platensis C1]MDT9261991.1 hypothetical protein [Limnospira sp. PMC 1236.20]MDT9303066.1 hypothetical protein [Limnospira sp. PMC 1281.21]QJB24637.1 hypothetical protein HFV01_01070 [Limnospira fusiformis SAG 85.79]
MDKEHEKEQTLSASDSQRFVRGEEEGCHNDIDGNSGQVVGSDGYRVDSEPFRTDRANCQGDYFQPGGCHHLGTGGKILDLLEELFAGFDSYVKSHEARLEQRLLANREYQSQMKEQMEKIRQEVLQQVSE